MKTKINAQIVAHSVNEQGDELISVLATFPRIILAEVNTHRMLSKNTSSSRAIPFKKMVETIKNDPFIPIAWQKEHKGMQGTEYLSEQQGYHSELQWISARNWAISCATLLNNSGTTKQLCNRLLEPFMWTTMLITGSREGWENFFNLRCPQYSIETLIDGDTRLFKSKKDLLKELDYEPINPSSDLDFLKMNKGQAEIHIMELAECIWDAYNESTPKILKPGDWHIPFEDKIKQNFALIPVQFTLPDSVRISVAMAARTSYTVVGEEKTLDYEAMLGLHDRLLAQDPPHSSPLEHCARAMTEIEYTAACSTGFSRKTPDGKSMYGWCNNFKGFIPYRYMVDNEK
jgi:hypothetical protein